MNGGGRRWLEVSVRNPSGEELATLLVEALLAVGGRAAEERDGWLITHIAAPLDLAAFLESTGRTLRAVTGLERLEIETRWREHEDWAETWKRGLGPRAITDRILVRPSWMPAPAESGNIQIVLDPGMAFGTSEHGTTRGCLRLLDRALRPGDRVLDVGSGSGILAIAAALLGASEVVALEGDLLACEALRENLVRNEVEQRVRCVEGLVDAAGLVAYGPATGVMANIESGVLESLMPGFVAVVRPGGWLILSGIQSEEWHSILEVAERAAFRLLALDSDGEWRSGLFEHVHGF